MVRDFLLEGLSRTSMKETAGEISLRDRDHENPFPSDLTRSHIVLATEGTLVLVSGGPMFNRNPSGKNQHGSIPKADDVALAKALESYHREKLTNNQTISERLKHEHGITMSASSVKRRRKELDLQGSGSVSKSMPVDQARQLVINAMDIDRARRTGVKGIQHKIAFDTATHLKRDFVSSVMHEEDPEGFDFRSPTAKKIQRFPKHPIGINERWAGDGHDKLNKIGIMIWAVVDDATSKWLGAWVVPNNRLGVVVAYLALSLIEEMGGIPLQFTTDCGSETTQLYGIMNALRCTANPFDARKQLMSIPGTSEILHPEYCSNELPAHVFLRSVHNVAIERSWLRLRMGLGDNAIHWFEYGINEGMYDQYDNANCVVCRWLWAKLMKQELQSWVTYANGVPMRKDKGKPGPSGMSRNQAYTLYESWGGRDCLLPVDNMELIHELKEALGGAELLEFCDPELSARAQNAFDSLGGVDLRFENVWVVFRRILPLVFPRI